MSKSAVPRVYVSRRPRFYKQLLRQCLPPRQKNSHKGLFGRVLVVGGGIGMPGAVYLAANAALRVGAGMVTVATHPQHVNMVLPLLPEALLYAIHGIDDLMPLLDTATVCVIGPGLGDNAWALALYDAVLASGLPLVVDASALRMLATRPQYNNQWVLTPHPGEAAALLSCSVELIQSNRGSAVARIQQQYGGTVVLKGAGTLIHWGGAHGECCSAGNPGMASAGMGDVLSGVIGGLLAEGVPSAEAARLGVWLHAQAGDHAVSSLGERGLLASDLMPYLRKLVN